MKGILVAGIVLLAIGAILVILGPSINKGIQSAKEDRIDRTLTVSNANDDDYLAWKSDGDEGDPTFYRNFYLFNITNLQEVYSGASPIVQEVGPYKFRRIREKIDIVFSSNEEEVSFKYYEHYHFLESESGGRTLNDSISNVNLAFLGVIARAGNANNLQVGLFSSYLNQVLTTLQTTFVNQTYLPSTTPQTIYQFASFNFTAFISNWVQGINTPINPAAPIPYALPVDLSSQIPLSTVANLFNPTLLYSLDHPTQFGLWQKALVDAETAKFLQSYWGLSASAQQVVSAWQYNWANNLGPLLITGRYGVASVNDLAYLQFGSLALTNNASLLVLSDSTDFYPEFAAFTRYVLGTPVNLDLATSKRIFDPVIGFRNTTVLGGFLIALASGATDFSAFGFSSQSQAFLFYQYIQYVLNNTLGNTYRSGSGLYTTQSVGDYLFGYEDQLLALVKSTSTRNILYFNYTSIQQASEAELPQSWYTGRGDISRINRYITWDGASSVNFWETPEVFDGTDGQQYSPRFNKDEDYKLFSDTLQRNVLLNYVGDMDVQGIELRRFELRSDQLKSQFNNPTNAKYYYYIDGVHNFTRLNVSGVVGLPIFLTKPHFLDVDPTWQTKTMYMTVDGTVQSGMSPSKEEHDTFIAVEPRTGKTMRIHQRLQFNIMLTPGLYGSQFNVTEQRLLPVYWADDDVEIRSWQAEKFKDTAIRAEHAGHYIVAIVTPIGFLILVAGLVCLILGLLKRDKKETGLPSN